MVAIGKVSDIEVHNAKLPANYKAAKTALASCYRLDECKDWKDKAAALASYARQSGDDSLFKTAGRIQGRATQRCGVLLKEYKSPGGRPSKTKEADSLSLPQSQAEAAQKAGLSSDQAKTAVRVANIPEDEFEELIESDKPPTVTALAKKGTKPRPKPIIDLGGRDPEDFKLSTKAQGKVREMAKFVEVTDVKRMIAGAFDQELVALRENLLQIRGWVDDALTSVGKG